MSIVVSYLKSFTFVARNEPSTDYEWSAIEGNLCYFVEADGAGGGVKEWIFVADCDTHEFMRFSLSDGRVSLLAGGAGEGFEHGTAESAKFTNPNAVCIDPIRSHSLYLGDRTSIRHLDETTDTISLVAGSEQSGKADGVGADARFCEVMDLLMDLLITS